MSSFDSANCGVHPARLGGALLAAVLLSACSGAAGTLAIRAERPGSHAPLAGLQVTALPVDAQALLDTLAQRSATPKPTFPDLEAEMRAYRRGHGTPAGDTRADDAWQATRDSLDALADTLRGLDRASVAYRQAYERLRSLYDRFSQRAARGGARGATFSSAPSIPPAGRGWRCSRAAGGWRRGSPIPRIRSRSTSGASP